MRDLINGRPRHARVSHSWTGTQVLLAVFLVLWLLAVLIAIAVVFEGFGQ